MQRFGACIAPTVKQRDAAPKILFSSAPDRTKRHAAFPAFLGSLEIPYHFPIGQLSVASFVFQRITQPHFVHREPVNHSQPLQMLNRRACSSSETFTA